MRLFRVALAWLFFCAPVFAQVGQIPGWPPIQPAATAPPVLTVVGSGALGVSGSTCTAATVNLGTTSGFTTRRIIMAINSIGIAAGSLSSATINGVSATINASIRAAGSNPYAAIISADVPSGSTNTTVTLTFSSSIFQGCGYTVYTVDDALLNSTTPSTGTGSGTAATSMATSSFTQTTGGFIIAAAGLDTAPTGLVITGYTTDNGGGTTRGVNSHFAPVVTTGSTTATANWSNSSAAAIAAAAWR